MTCLACDGGGGSAGTDDLLCAACNGTGEVAVPAPQTNCAPECPDCHGIGMRRGGPLERCPSCQPPAGDGPRTLGRGKPIPHSGASVDICEGHCRAVEARESWTCPLCEAQAEAAINASMLAHQCNLARAAETAQMEAEAEAARLRAALEAYPDSDLAALAAATLRQARAADDEHEEAARLRDALRRHGRHDADCGRLKPAYYAGGRPVGHGDCTCGFDAVEAGETLLAPESAEHRPPPWPRRGA